MPIIEFQLFDPQRKNEGLTLQAIVDSGADGTLIPNQFLKKLNLRSTRKAQMRGVSGYAYPVDLYLVSLQIATLSLYGVWVVSDKQNQIIMGRNVLNQMRIHLDGLSQVIEILD